MVLSEEYIQIRNRYLENEFSDMNPAQREVIFQVNGQVVVIAGAGSGKTTVIVNRIFNMVTYGNAYFDKSLPMTLSRDFIEKLKSEINFKRLIDFEKYIEFKKINPGNILAITFTNKAALELKNRLSLRLGQKSYEVIASTFHSLCVKILRSHAEKLNYSSNFTIYDTEDSRKLVKDCQKSLGIDEKMFSVKNAISSISRAKNELLSEKDFKEKYGFDSKYEQASQIYEMYQMKIREALGMDFDDLIFNTILLFEKFPDVLEEYRKLFRFIMVDEYQDTNYAQHVLIGKLTGRDGNLCIVGDDDQSIYKFRGALVENMLNFEKQYKNAKIVRLEQNYRSTKNILSAANSVIENNLNRKGKILWTDNPEGAKVKFHIAFSEHNETDIIVNEIKVKIEAGFKCSDFAVLYRMSSQSNVIERVFARNNLPYKVVGGVKFFERKEIKDLISYLSVINNVSDEIRLKRIINRPKRSIGERTVAQISNVARKENKTIYEIMKNISLYSNSGLSRCASKILDFVKTMEGLIESYRKNNSLLKVYNELLDKIKYIDFLKQEDDETDARVANIKELASAIARYEEENENSTLSGFLEEVSLDPEINKEGDVETGEITLMTIHAAKGLEFPVVFLPGFEEGIFPSTQCVFKPQDLEEERRLAYVAITRAKKELFILYATSRMIFGSVSYNRPSRFLGEIPEEIIEKFKSRGWSKPKSGEEKLASAYEVKVKSMVSARSFGTSSSNQGLELEILDENFSPGRNVSHDVFGKGKIISIIPNSECPLLKIDFEKFGAKKILSKFTKLEK